ncbi:MAG: hypothetical protein ACRD38_08180, partial [Nitrososphaerales archaeon]
MNRIGDANMMTNNGKAKTVSLLMVAMLAAWTVGGGTTNGLTGVIDALLPSFPEALAAPNQIPSPVSFPAGTPTTLTLRPASSGAPHTGSAMAVWNPFAGPTFDGSCPLPGAAGSPGSIKWQVMADAIPAATGDGVFETPVGYFLPTTGTAGGPHSIAFAFGDGTLIGGAGIAFSFTGLATISPPGLPATRYAWVDVT